MNLQKIEAAMHTPEQVRDIIAEAMNIAAEGTGDEVGAEVVFEQACQLLGQKAVSFVAEPTGPPVDLNRLLAR